MKNKKIFLLSVGICVIVASLVLTNIILSHKKQKAYETFYNYAEINFEEPIDLNVYYSFLAGKYQAEYKNNQTNVTYFLWLNDENEVCHRVL